MMRKCHVRFGGGPMEKEPNRYLASGLPYYMECLASEFTSPLLARVFAADEPRTGKT